MPSSRQQLLAVGAVVAVELLLGAFLVARGGGTPANPNPYRVGEGFPVPPPCSMIDRALVGKVLGSDDHQLTESTGLEGGDDPLRTCVFQAARSELATVGVSMVSHLVQGQLEISALGISDFEPLDNLTRQEAKRYDNYASIAFEIDNLDVRVDYRYPAKGGMPPPEVAARIRADVQTLTKQIAGQLTPRNKTGPTLPSIPPSPRRR